MPNTFQSVIEFKMNKWVAWRLAWITWLAPFTGLAFLVAGCASAIWIGWEVAMTFVATGIPIAHFGLKQKLEETRIFIDLFNRMNERYDKLNDTLQEIKGIKPNQLSDQQRHALDDYFNLCAEEYYFYLRGYIDKAVWSVWYSGMQYYLGYEAFSYHWENERHRNAYYGLECILRPGCMTRREQTPRIAA